MDPRDRRAAAALSVVFRTHSDIEASLVRGLLEAHGIYAALSSDVPHSVFPLTIDGLGEVRISVAADQADEARDVIAQQRVGGPDAGAGEGAPDTRDLSELELRLGHRFEDPRLLDRALTHRSRANEDVSGAIADNESLEFLGDAVLGFVIADFLFREFPQFDEGQKSKIKASLVSTTTLAEQARRIGLGDFLALGRGEEKTGGRPQARAAGGRLRGRHRGALPGRRASRWRGTFVRREFADAARGRAKPRVLGARLQVRAPGAGAVARAAAARVHRSRPRAARTTARSSRCRCASRAS